MEKIIILDFETAEIHIFNFNSKIFDHNDIEHFFDVLREEDEGDFNSSNCEWMITKDNITLKIH